MAGTHKKVTLELGGKAANVVFDDAPLDQAIEGIINGIYFNQGEVCCAGSRLFVQESVYEPLLDKLKDRLSTLRVGDPLDKNTDVGAINSAGQLAKIQELVESGIAEGAEIFQPDCELPDKGFFFRPTLFTGVSQSHRIAQEEIFGPVLSVLTFRTPEEAVEKANNTPYGLSAGVWTEKGSRIFKMVGAMKAGVVWANTFNRFDPTSPFGGYKESGYGREGGRPRPRGLHPAGRGGLDRWPPLRRPVPPGRSASPRAVLEPRSPAPLALRNGQSEAADRLGVRKTYKLFIGGEFPRTESGRAYEVHGAEGELLANACRGTRKDIRDAVRAARTAQPGWADKTAFNRSQILYRIAELMEGRRDQFVAEVRVAEGVGLQRARRLVDAAIDRWVWYAGWADKFPQILGNVNPVAGSLLQLLDPRADRRGRGSSRPRTRRCSGS